MKVNKTVLGLTDGSLDREQYESAEKNKSLDLLEPLIKENELGEVAAKNARSRVSAMDQLSTDGQKLLPLKKVKRDL